ncbi:40S ribosomal protein S5-1 [Hordeum vulgare]|nr:40S ribosomal protein S5-1 [Hordeum vulgare]
MEPQVLKCHGMVERGLNANHLMIMEFTHKHKMDAKDLWDHIFKIYEKIEHLQAHIYELQNQTADGAKGDTLFKEGTGLYRYNKNSYFKA